MVSFPGITPQMSARRTSSVQGNSSFQRVGIVEKMKPSYYLKDLSCAKHKLKPKLLSDATMTFGDNIYIPMPRTQIITELSTRHPRPPAPQQSSPNLTTTHLTELFPSNLQPFPGQLGYHHNFLTFPSAAQTGQKPAQNPSLLPHSL